MFLDPHTIRHSTYCECQQDQHVSAIRLTSKFRHRTSVRLLVAVVRWRLQQISHQRHQNSVADLHRFHQVIFSSLISIVGETEEKRLAVSGNLFPFCCYIHVPSLLSFPLVLRASCTNLFFILHLFLLRHSKTVRKRSDHNIK